MGESDRKNTNSEIDDIYNEAFAAGKQEGLIEGRRLALEEAAKSVEGIKQIRLPYIFRGLDRTEDADGWSDLGDSEKSLLKSAAGMLRRLINREPPPQCEHPRWSLGDNPICIMCGISKSATKKIEGA